MSDATVTPATIRPSEAEHFGALAQDWWDPKGTSAMLHRLNPVRLAFIRDAVDMHWGGDIEAAQPLAGKTALDVGCGAGLLAEPLARLGAEVTGVDAAAENVAVARLHAEGMGLSVDYRHGELGELGLGTFDLVTCLEVIEHVADKPAFIAQLAARLADGGLMVLSTPNRTVKSRLLLTGAAEAVGAVPRGTHDWGDFITPDELTDLLTAAGLRTGRMKGIAFNPLKGFEVSDDTSLDYILSVTR
ncbi:bifunctional 2-polyprenyl-6-hydroxyphenol methylase/3-demethylubiquinol 3-O-methyltransferase UbiG [Paraurantiacibacter namhicola]|uniref:Ubiquinone biosynthesis O-methyltransferase n=1 Tax=Paraurantiacibacter namhicola TaxID=645517 RepID=A0A1C7D4V7_9SPHN|nr:bifunctional 2-polyprenyl-6-hydroxyphenol methylase/3-demethylubiquinol 3-O-methyltransferase UbiG [Paraurantiacibacter namhicola]ANU06494.1 Ubiquinone biosynthesis O-methyltransferase [Paraurantiacibacter namhicola]